MNEYDKIIRNNIRDALIECRAEKDISQAELSKAIGVPAPTIASWEQGISLPNLQTLYRLAKYYQKTMDYMYGEGRGKNESVQEESTERASTEADKISDIH